MVYVDPSWLTSSTGYMREYTFFLLAWGRGFPSGPIPSLHGAWTNAMPYNYRTILMVCITYFIIRLVALEECLHCSTAGVCHCTGEGGGAAAARTLAGLQLIKWI